MRSTPPRKLYYANVLYLNVLRNVLIRNVLIRLAQSGLVHARWTDRILHEIFRIRAGRVVI
ncbi:hypothetical protein GQ649_28755 [Rhodococcus sp. DSM 6344]|nr:hypothetical protein [Rhodococcus erythropolis]